MGREARDPGERGLTGVVRSADPDSDLRVHLELDDDSYCAPAWTRTGTTI
jgi:hypothetical protein